MVSAACYRLNAGLQTEFQGAAIYKFLTEGRRIFISQPAPNRERLSIEKLWQTLSISESWFCSSWSAASTSAPARKCKGTFMENLIAGVVALLLFIYLLVAMIRPEKF